MGTTIAVSEELRNQLMRLKHEEGARSMDELIGQILIDHHKMRFLEASSIFRQKLSDAGIRFEELVT